MSLAVVITIEASAASILMNVHKLARLSKSPLSMVYVLLKSALEMSIHFSSQTKDKYLQVEAILICNSV